MRNGANTGTQNHQRPPNGETYAAYVNRRNNNVQADRGLHESHSYYDDCTRRDRNEGNGVIIAAMPDIFAFHYTDDMM